MRQAFREAPATCTLCIAWIVVYVSMILWQRELVVALPWQSPMAIGRISVAATHIFGDVTPAEIYAGQIWRGVTATFIHYSLIHILLNVYGLYQLGSFVEDSYGSKWFLSIYLLIGWVGNLMAAAMRPLLNNTSAGWYTHSAGGSTVVFGLVGLCAVVGWRSKTRVGDYIFNQMIILLVINGFLGMFVAGIDNSAHLCGAIVGAAIGFTHRFLIQSTTKRMEGAAGLIAALALLSCVLAQFVHARPELAAERVLRKVEPKVAADQERLKSLLALREIYHELIKRNDNPPRILLGTTFGPKELVREVLMPDQKIDKTLHLFILELLRYLKKLDHDFPMNGSDADYRAFRALAARALSKPPLKSEVDEFDQRLRHVWGQAQSDLNTDRIRALEASNALQPPRLPSWAKAQVPVVPPTNPANTAKPQAKKAQ